jgi:hypothetical protein
MPDIQQQDRFDLSRFVLDFLEQEGSVVTPPAFGIHEVLMPEELAEKFNLDEFARLSFGTEKPPAGEDVVQLSVNHPLVEAIADQVTERPANATVYVNSVRLEKRGLFELARKEFSFPNARIEALPMREESRELHHYVQFNFKVTTIGEEKQEEQASVIMDLQAGHAVTDPSLLEQLAIYEVQPGFDTLPVARPRWPGAGPALSQETLLQLLPRAENALQKKLANRLTALAERIQHHLALDLARIEEYYDELANDLRRRRSRTSGADAERGQTIDDKLAVLEAERKAKAEDAHGRYTLNVEMELVNALLIVQPKVTLPVSVANRTTAIERTLVWDPLLHRLEPLVCDVCTQPGKGVHLCAGGHLAHRDCLAPQCIDCKRAHCQLCSDQIEACVVCHQPVCRQSLITCPTCKRGTCSEHQNLCHAANDGQPAILTAEAPPAPPATPEKAADRTPNRSSKRKEQERASTPRDSKTRSPATKRSTAKTPPPTPVVQGVRINIEIRDTDLVVVAFVMRSTRRVLATRSFELTPKGILVSCQCEKSPCPANGYYHRPAPAAAIHAQIEEMLKSLQREYLIPTKKVDYYYLRGQEIETANKLILPDLWRDPMTLAESTRGFDAMARNR